MKSSNVNDTSEKIFIGLGRRCLSRAFTALSTDRARPRQRRKADRRAGRPLFLPALMSQRENLAFDGPIESDTAALHGLVAEMLRASEDIHCLRDPTRGGGATTLHEIAISSNVGVNIYASKIPVPDSVQGACEILGLDPLYVANEGKLCAIVAAPVAEAILDTMRRHPLGRDACLIGEVVAEHPRMVVMKTEIGGSRIVDVPFTEQLPRIC
jgi:hydrogenase expression/formation protein HypE